MKRYLREINYSSHPRRSVPAKIKKETCGHRLLEDKIESPAKVHLDGSPSGLDRPKGSPSPRWRPPRPIFLWLADRWALVLSLGCILLGTPVSSGLWAPFVSEMQVTIFCAFLVRSLVFSFVFHLWVPADHNSPKLVELISYKPYN